MAQVCARLRFRHLQFLDILGQTRNLRLTAEQMHITQPAATKILMDIEEILESRLFDRLSRGMRPNELGLFTLRYAASALAGHRKFVDEFNALKEGGHGHLTIGAITGSAAHVLTASVAEIQRLRPLLVLKVLEQSSDQLIVWLAERKIDLMIGRFTDEAQRAQFHYERLSNEPLLVVGGLHHPLRGARDLDMAELSHWPWILYPASTAVRRVSDDIFGRNGLALSSGVVETPSFLFALQMMQTTDMLSLQPQALVERYIAKGLLARIPVDLPDRMPDYGLITRLGESPTPAMQAFIDVLREVASPAADGP
ncbi:LysR family transcriptional regulator [Acidovorax sp. Leaf76]|uniref:LysR family transcriptional regulator n=1 Tax=unclassified Acidovorax TaxID=2684926 RepID=UPI0006FB3D4E|nr:MULTISPECIES: LysR family transcriptional regulator [unclassified Acidovorax]KQO24651.1 LysR family transcriptional regulator [Acidovorax sp. Leaf76]KQS24944.1 LysR family transcriptional regulator [Acidovorax sp. Leaf191]